jgi:long-chain-fatty-acid--[acyl-carrier-protein] ligase
MLGPVRYLVWLFGRVVLSLRYRQTVTGLWDAARRPGPFLVLANHPGYTDPPAVFRALWGRLRIRPVLRETNFRSPFLAPLGWVLGAIKVPETDTASAEAHRRAEAAVAAAADALRAGENVVLWPAGTLSRDGTEKIGAARTAAEVLRAVPHATVLLVRTRGLWGSSFGWARGGKPILVDRLLAGIGWLALNLFVLAPRRKVHVHVEAFGPGERPEPTREALNPWLEAWYEADGGERPTFVPYHSFIGPQTYHFPPPVRAAGTDLSRVKPATREAVAQILADRLKRELTPDENRAETTLAGLGLDSLEAAEVALEVEQRFGFGGATVPTTVDGLWALAEGLVDGAATAPPPAAWFAPPSDAGPFAVLGETIPEAFLARAMLHP